MKVTEKAKTVMTRAWAIAKAAAAETGEKASTFFRESLKMAWAEIKAAAETTTVEFNWRELPELTGTPKQVAWAEKVRKNKIPTIKYLINIVKDFLSQSKNAENNAKFEQIINGLQDVAQTQSAKFWIENNDANHDVLVKGTLFYKLGQTSTSANQQFKIVGTYNALKQHGFIA